MNLVNRRTGKEDAHTKSDVENLPARKSKVVNET